MNSQLITGTVLLAFLATLNTIGYLRFGKSKGLAWWQMAWRWWAMLAALYYATVAIWVAFAAAMVIIFDLSVPDSFFTWFFGAMAAPFVQVWQWLAYPFK